MVLPLHGHTVLLFTIALDNTSLILQTSIWGNKNNATLMKQLQVLQNKVANLILDHHL